MRVSVAAFGVGLLLASAVPVRSEVTVRVAAGKVDITASAAPLPEVLRRLAEQTGMKVHYEGAEPRDLVTVTLPGRSPVEAVNDLLKERKLNYALAVDGKGQVVTLIIVTAVRPHVTQEIARPKAPDANAGPTLRPLFEMLEQNGTPVDASLRAAFEAGAPEPEMKAAEAEDVPLPELIERMSVPPEATPAEASPAEIPEGSLLRLLFQPGPPQSAEPRVPTDPAEKPTGAATEPKAQPTEPPPR